MSDSLFRVDREMDKNKMFHRLVIRHPSLVELVWVNSRSIRPGRNPKVPYFNAVNENFAPTTRCLHAMTRRGI